MATLNKKSPAKKAAPKAAATGTALNANLAQVLLQARITEKATVHSLNNSYVFNVATKATKRDIIRTVEALYKVTPRHVTIAAIPTKNVRNRRTGKTGVKGGGKKAYVYLKKGETITI